MKPQAGGFVRRSLIFASLLLTGCARAPAFDILGSFFPAWLFCAVLAIFLAVASLRILRSYIEIAWSVAVYPSLTALFAFALWLTLFR